MPGQDSYPLAGVRVVELGIWIQAPLAAQILGDLGAQVTKVERPDGGDFARGLKSLYGVPLHGDENGGLLWQLCNRNKRSLALNLKSGEGRSLMHRIVAQADVFVTNLQPSELANLGVSPEELMAVNPRLVYAIGAGLAVEGALADVPCQDTTAMAISGFMYAVSGDPATPYYPPGAMIDVLSATNLAATITAALLQRRDGGKGQVVSTSLLHSAVWLQMLNMAVIQNQREAMPPFDRTAAANPLMDLYRCGDSKWLAFGMLVLKSADWRKLCEILGSPELADDPRFGSNTARSANNRELITLITNLTARRQRDELIALMTKAGLPCTPVLSPPEVLEHPGVVEQSLVGQTKQGLRFVRAPMNIPGAPPSPEDSPSLGDSTFQVLNELGISNEEIVRLRDAEVVW